jgi:hypothetical protein
MNKDLKVLAECVDARSGKRFRAGDEFSPVPTPEQAERLVRAGCLPEPAIAVAKKGAAEAEKRADAAAKAAAEAEEKARKVAAATDAVTAATRQVEEAEAAVAAARGADEKAAAGNRLAEAKAAADDADKALAKLTK